MYEYQYQDPTLLEYYEYILIYYCSTEIPGADCVYLNTLASATLVALGADNTFKSR